MGKPNVPHQNHDWLTDSRKIVISPVNVLIHNSKPIDERQDFLQIITCVSDST